MIETFQKMNFYCCMMPTTQRIPIFPTKITSILTWKNSTKVSVWLNFVFEKGTYHFSQRLPDSYICEQGTVCDGIEGLCLLLRRLAYPCRYSDRTSVEWLFGDIIHLSPEGEVNSGGYIPRREASRYISTALHRP